MACRVYVLLTWTTYGREPLVTAEVEALLTRLLPRIARRQGATPLALGIVPDHVHLLLRLPLEVDFPRLAQALKGATARIANREGVAKTKLRWASGYDLRSVGVREVHTAREYVRSQKRRHGYVSAVPG